MRAWRAVILIALAAACATTGYSYDPQALGDHCIDACPEGMACVGTEYDKNRSKTRPGRCQLAAGRCAEDADCGHGQQCVRTSEHLGLCAPTQTLTL